MPPFGLGDTPCLLARRLDSNDAELLSLLELLLNAHEIDRLVVDVPTQWPALLRQLLLPVVMDALGRPADRAQWAKRFEAGRFSDTERELLRSYLEEHRERFDLFSEQAPFAQAAGLRTTKNETKGAALLVATAAFGNNVPLFDNRTEANPLAMTPDQGLRWLLHAHCWDTAAIKTGAVGDPAVKAGKTTGNPTGPLGSLGVVVPRGQTLYETIMLNLPIGVQPGDDRPRWRRPQPDGSSWNTRHASGLLDLWTWQSRRIRLIPEETPAGIRVSQVVLCAGDRLLEIPEWEPHTTWAFQKVPKSRTGTIRRPRRHVQGKALWRGLDALLTSEPQSRDGAVETSVLLMQLAGLQAEDHLDYDYPLQLDAVGIAYGNQSAVIEDVMSDSIPLPVAALRADEDLYTALLEMTEQAEQLARAVNNLSADLRRAMGAEPIPWDKGQRPGEFVLHALDPLVRRLLTGMRKATRDPDLIEQGRTAWEQLAKKHTQEVADTVMDGATPGAFIGRTVKKENRELTFRSSTAQKNFIIQLGKILPRAAQERRKSA
ncbi:type I-E CRISPR-associated protein Cse1/CasA [Herbidospora daliensis]|uniref:type I-E CRISPR-associated protein Cse1/CasA n=1 Tax=Herbidospora daliensis TaxID=295585 RepID=UPI000A077C06|nr:type I-E CRISPR-associated protein Cse1/CasA [Herbidospora daliensis]